MFRWANIRIRTKLLTFFVAIGIIPLVAITLSISVNLKKELTIQAFEKLRIIQTERLNYIEKMFSDLIKDTQLIAENRNTIELLKKINKYRLESNILSYGRFPTHTEAYNKIAMEFDEELRKIMTGYNGSDLFLISHETGQVLYSIEKNTDLGSNLKTGPLKTSGLGRIWKKINSDNLTEFIDFTRYSPSNNEFCAFLGHPIKGHDGKTNAILVLQLKSNAINKIVQSRQNMGETGESYIMSYIPKSDLFEVRSNIKTMGNGKYIIGYRHSKNLDYWVDAKKSLKRGGSGIYRDSSGKDVLVAYNKIDIKTTEWYLISKKDKSEVFIPIKRLFFIVFSILCIVILITLIGSVLFSRTISAPLFKIIQFAEAIAKGNLDATIREKRKDELGNMINVLNNMSRKLYIENWMKSGKEGLDDVMRGEHKINQLASNFISFFVTHLDASLGAVYHCYDRKNLKLISSYAFSDRSNNFNRIEIGEGLIGQAALEQKILYFTDAKRDVPLLNNGIEEKRPMVVMAAPLVFEGELIGAFMVGSMQPFTDQQKEFTKLCIENISVIFKAALSRETIKDLLQASEQQQEELRVANEELEEQTKALKHSETELQAQQEELRVTNEELEEQTKALKKSESELQAQQEELRVTNEELEERTKSIEAQSKSIRDKNIKLNKIRKEVEKKAEELETANKYKSEFLANMSHELRTPLNSILILAKIFTKNRDKNLSDKQIESAKAIYSSGSDLLKIINEILDLSKVEAGKLDLFFEKMSITGLTADLKRIFLNQAKDKGIDFSIEKSENIPKELHTDSHRLQQILRNLLSNAFKFTENGRVKVLIRRPQSHEVRGTELKENSSTIFEVIDNGIGIPKDKQQGIFEAFQQVDGSISRQYGGTGLGLSISRALTHALGGIIKLESQENKGSRFTIILPDYYSPENIDIEQALKSQESATSESQNNPEPQGAEIVKNQPEPSREEKTEIRVEKNEVKKEIKDDRNIILPQDKTILLIEDDEVFLKILADIARESGFKCLVAENGEKGLLLAATHKPSAIILDVGLPGIDGWTVMERLKSNSELRHIPVHFISGNDSAIDAMRMGAIGYLIKPVTMEKITTAFEKIESTISTKIKKLLVVEDDEIQQKSIAELIGNNDVVTTIASTGEKAFQELSKNTYDCMVLDLGLSDMSGFSLLDKIKNSPTTSRIPIIIYTGRDLSRDEESELRKYAESIIIKGVKSPERLLDETALFLHRVESNLPPEKREILNMVHNKEEVLKGKHVLLVDDDMRNVFALTSILEEHLMKVTIARDGIESIQKLEEVKDIDLVLMDIMMPRMDGYEAMKKIRENKKFHKLPIIALTAKAMKGDRTKCIEAGASDYLAKPVNVEKLISMLRVWLYR